MPELRKDPVIGRWVIIATERARRPGNFIEDKDSLHKVDASDCRFCRGDEEPIYAQDDVRVFPYKDSFLSTKGHLERRAHGLYEILNGFGTHEVVVETKDHIANMADLDVGQIRNVLKTYQSRLRFLQQESGFPYVFVYKNYGTSAGSRQIGHARSHIVATSTDPLRIKEKYAGVQDYYREHNRCIFCDLIEQEIKFSKRIILETENFIVVAPFAARFLFETTIFPKNHQPGFGDMEGLQDELAGVLKTMLMKFKTGLDNPSYNFMIQTHPDNFHWHIELMPRMTRIAGFEKGAGFYICPIPPEDIAEYLRGVDA